jgi:lincosamide nucleotidyltransferase A/C/D/E
MVSRAGHSVEDWQQADGRYSCPMMTAEDVLELLDLMEAAGVRPWLDGGWGVDALLGEQTRPHADLDIAIRHDDNPALLAALEAAGFHLYRDDGPFNYVVEDGRGRLLDVHLVDLSSTRLDERGVEVYGPDGLAYDAGAFAGSGTILGREVACCTAEYQVRSHTGYPLDEDDYRDVMALHRAFGIPLPEPYRAGDSPPRED